MSLKGGSWRLSNASVDQPAVPPSSQMMMHTDEEVMSSTSAMYQPRVNEIQAKVLARQKGATVGLINRLYDTSSNCQALVAVRQREKLLKRRAENGSDDTVPRDKMSKPPFGKTQPPPAFKTTILKTDYNQQKGQSTDDDGEIMRNIPNHL